VGAGSLMFFPTSWMLPVLASEKNPIKLADRRTICLKLLLR
jgi:hypothetical protein